jgi:hypothetical protein
LKRYLTWFFDSFQNLKITESGNGIIVQGNKAFYEHVIAGTMQGAKGEGLTMCAFEFTGEKIQQVRKVYDRLLICKQAAKGWLAKWIVNSIVSRAEKGLH